MKPLCAAKQPLLSFLPTRWNRKRRRDPGFHWLNEYLLTALWGGLVRLGWALPPWPPRLPAVHGPLTVCGFLGTLIGVERAVALGAVWPYAAPLLTAVGTLALLTGLPAPPLMTLGSLGLVTIFVVIMHRQCALATVIMALGALL